LELLARKTDNFLNTTFANLPGTQQMESPGLLELHSTDATARGIADGDPVRIFNDRGELTLHARVNGSIPCGVVAARLHWAKLTEGGKNINVLTSQRLTDIGRGATFYATLVQVEKVR
jgi:anaerobic selenocysteine-containing dehydrogenase